MGVSLTLSSALGTRCLLLVCLDQLFCCLIMSCFVIFHYHLLEACFFMKENGIEVDLEESENWG